MSNLLIFYWTCPYCGHTNHHQQRPESPYYPEREVTYCDPDEGGCDKLVVVEPAVTVTANAYKVLTPRNAEPEPDDDPVLSDY